MDDVIEEFLVESQEAISEVETDLIGLEEDRSPERIQRIFRNVHTIKGTCGFLGFEHLESVGHAAENLLSLLRSGDLEVNPDITSVLLSSVDAIREMLVAIEQTETDGDSNYEDLVVRLEKVAKGDPLDDVPAPAEAAPEPAPEPEPAAPEPAAAAPEPEPEPEATPEPASAAPAHADFPELVQLPDTPAPAPEAAAAAPAPEPPKPEPPKPEPKKAEPAKKTEEHTDGPKVAESSIRVSVDLLDTLMNLVGELVLVRNQMLQMSTVGDQKLASATQRLNHVTAELQEGVMRTRMQPIGQVWNKLPRVVRDLARSLGKKVRLQLDGKETELDKTILEAIKDPLTHLVRNAIDHGIELPDVRRAKGKSDEGVLLLRAYHEGGQVMLEIIDDGGGIDPARIAEKALAKGLVAPEALPKMSDRALLDFIFHPGFSTAAKVTNVSGRGVGMDVVKTNIERIGGSIDVNSSQKGTTFRIRIPLTLAIVPALVVSTGGERFAIPQVNLVELVRLADAAQSIEYVHGTPVYRLRGDLMPLIYLHEVLGLEPQLSGEDDEAKHIAVLQAGEHLFGLVVEEIRDTEEIVVKALGTNLDSLDVFSGATIMGDGRVALILDAPGLARRAGLDGGNSDGTSHLATADHAEVGAEEKALLLLSVGEDRHVAVPLERVARLEEIEAHRIESAGDRSVVQYRGGILPVRDLGSVLYHMPVIGMEGVMQLVVIERDGKAVGLAVERLVDIVEEAFELDETGSRSGIKGNAIVHGRIVELLDVDAQLDAATGFGGNAWMG